MKRDSGLQNVSKVQEYRIIKRVSIIENIAMVCKIVQSVITSYDGKTYQCQNEKCLM